VSKTEAEKFAERMRRNTGADEAANRGSCSLRSWWLLRQSCSAKHQTQKLAKDLGLGLGLRYKQIFLISKTVNCRLMLKTFLSDPLLYLTCVPSSNSVKRGMLT